VLNGRHAQKTGIKLIIGSEFRLDHGYRLVLLARNHTGYTSLCGLISDARCNAEKGDYLIEEGRLAEIDSEHCIAILIPPHLKKYHNESDAASDHHSNSDANSTLKWFKKSFIHHWLSLTILHSTNDQNHIDYTLSQAKQYRIPLVASGDVHMHARHRRALQDVVTCIRENCTLQSAGRKLLANGEQHLRSIESINSLYPQAAIQQSVKIAELCEFNLDELNYQYPKELVDRRARL